ncbi:hypothetical protein IAC76_00845 [Spirochaetes bacterium]|uniref:Uncharacterized protein n=1 Tax=Candidatus Scatousia excrementipullorum TaxID=2840936 RepID=A0A9D9DPQ7_9BACT|nr:hypothetical protein [Candidatus Scatousia excrementipullorum]
MERKLFRAGNGWSLFLPKVIIELLKIDPENDTIEMQIENDILKIKKVEKSDGENK